MTQINQQQQPQKDGNLVIDGMMTIIAILRTLNMGYHHAHANVKGANYYGDHLLLQRLYIEGSSVGEIDTVMERLKGLYPTRLIQMGETLDRMEQEHEIISAIDSPGGENVATFQALVKLEMRLQGVIAKLVQALEDRSILGNGTDGTINLLQGIADKHQGSVYLINQRIQ